MRNPIIETMTTEGDMSDPWGTVLSTQFDIAEILWIEGEYVPNEWEFRPAAGLHTVSISEYSEDHHSFVAEMWLNGYVDADTMRQAGTILSRYLNILRLAGMDY